MIEIRFPDKATLYQSPCANCPKSGMNAQGESNSLLVNCDKQLCYEINEFSENHPTVNIVSG